MSINTKQLMNGSGIGILQQLNEDEQIDPHATLSLDLSETSPIDDSLNKTGLAKSQSNDDELADVGCSIDDDDDDDNDQNQTPYPESPSQDPGGGGGGGGGGTSSLLKGDKSNSSISKSVSISNTNKPPKHNPSMAKKNMSIVVTSIDDISTIQQDINNKEEMNIDNENLEQESTIDSEPNAELLPSVPSNGSDSNNGLPKFTEEEYSEQYENDQENKMDVNDELKKNNNAHLPLIPTSIKTVVSDESVEEQKSAKLEPVQAKKLNGRALSSLSPLGLSPMEHQQHTSDMLNMSMSMDNMDEEWLFDAEESHLKEQPDSPYDVNTTQREFANTAQVIVVGCNNPHKLFKILKAMTMKLFLNDMKYRVLSAKSNRLRVKLLNYDGVEEWLGQLGFKLKDNGNKLQCPIDQPPLCVLDDAVHVCNDFISKCSRRRAVIDTIRRFNPSNLQEIVKGTEFEYEEKSNQPSHVTPGGPDDEMMIIEMDEPSDDDDDGNDANEEEGKQQQQQQPEGVKIEGVSMLVPGQLQLHDKKSTKAEIEAAAIQETLDSLVEARESTNSVATELLQDDELEGTDDTFELYDIISSITHSENSDNSARQIILLCYTTFTEAQQIFNCLDRRFFTKLPNEKTWIIQTKIVSFIQIWMRQYWDEDWESDIFLFNRLEDWFKKVELKYGENDLKKWRKSKYKKLVDMLIKTMEFQRANKRNQSISQNNPHEWGMTRIKKSKDIIEKQFNDTYDFFKLNNTKIARQITHMDMTYFAAIKARECLGQAWKKKINMKLQKIYVNLLIILIASQNGYKHVFC